MFKSIFYNLMLYIDKKIGAAKIFEALKHVTIGQGSQLYPEATICNLNGDPKNILIGKNTHIRGELMTMNYGGKIEVGNDSFIGAGCRIWSGESIKIGSNVLISHNVNIFDTDTHEMDHIERAKGYQNLLKNGQPKNKGLIKTAAVVIEDDVWVSFNVIILKGVKIGKGAVLAAGAVITTDVPEFSMVAGNPGKVIKKVNSSS